MSFGEILLRVVVIPLVVMIGALTTVPIWIWMERRLCARIQQRQGPNRVGPGGLLQPIADAVKLLFKEDLTPAHVDRLVYLLAPVLTLIPAVAALAVIPFSDRLQVADVNIGILYVLALSSLAVYGVVLAGWSSNNKWSLMGGVRSAAQMVSYELALGLAVIAVVMTTSAYVARFGGPTSSALSLRTMVESQQGVAFFGWNLIWQLPAFIIFCIGAVAETNRGPFDLPEAEQELTGGFHTEYSSFRFALFYMGEYAHMVTLSSVGTCLFLGGWMSPFANIPLLSNLNVSQVPVLGVVAPLAWFALKVTCCIFLFIWLRFTVPRMRWDQLMRLGWMVLLPAGLVWLVAVALLQGVAGVLAGIGTAATSLGPVGFYRCLYLLALAVVAILVMTGRATHESAD